MIDSVLERGARWLSGRGRPRPGGEVSRGTWGEALAAYGFLAPAMLLIVIFTLAPFVYVFYASTLHAPGAPNQRFVGLDNYRYLLDPSQQSGFGQAMLTTGAFVLGVVPAGTLLSLACALLLRGKTPGWTIFRLLFFLPFVTPALPTSIVWLWIFNPQYGLLNYLLGLLHLPRLGWIDDPSWALPSVIIYSLWQSAGFNTVVLLAGLSAIPRELEEAARVDGAGALSVVRHVTVPLLTPTIFFVLTVATIESLKVFTQIFALTGGGPAGATTTIGFLLYQDAFAYFHLDLASAIAVIMFALITAFTAAQWWISNRWVYYQ